jgi:hypothetical protein
VENKHDTGKALSIRAHQLARAVYGRLTRQTACELAQCLRTYGCRAREPGAERDTQGMRLHRTDVKPSRAASGNAAVRLGPLSLSPVLCLDTRAGSYTDGVCRLRLPWAAPLPPLSLPGEPTMLSPLFA